MQKKGFRTLAEEQETVAARAAEVDDAQKQYFERGRMQGIFEESAAEPAQAADNKEVSGLKEAVRRARAEDARDQGDDMQEQEGSIIIEEGDMTIEVNMKKDAKPLSQLVKLQQAYVYNRPSRIFHGRHRDKLKRYVTPNQFEGDVVFHQEAVYCLQQRFDDGKCQARLTIKQIPILQLLDHSPKDVFQENYPAKQMAKLTTFDNSAAAKDLARLSSQAQRVFSEAFQLHQVKRDSQWLQNGKHLYLFTLTRKGNMPSGSSVFRVLEIDLETGKEATVPGLELEEQDGDGGRTTLSVGFVKRETDKRYPHAGVKVVA